MYNVTYDELTDEMRDAYLARIGVNQVPEPTLENLHMLIYQHQCTVPFENMDLYPEYHEIKLDTESLYDKIVTRHRGGYCFELNGMFVLLLRKLGYEAYSVVCRVMMGGNTLRGLSHRGCVIKLDGEKYIADVGFGGPMAPFAVPLNGEKVTLHGETFWVDPVEDGWFIEVRLDSEGKEWPVIMFADARMLAADFIPLNEMISGTPQSGFRQRANVSVRRPDGHCNLMDRELKILKDGETTIIPVTDENFHPLLKEYFGIEL